MKQIAHLLRKKSKLLVAFGSCSHLGGIPGLANLFDIETLLERVFDTAPSLDGFARNAPAGSEQGAGRRDPDPETI